MSRSRQRNKNRCLLPYWRRRSAHPFPVSAADMAQDALAWAALASTLATVSSAPLPSHPHSHLHHVTASAATTSWQAVLLEQHDGWGTALGWGTEWPTPGGGTLGSGSMGGPSGGTADPSLATAGSPPAGVTSAAPDPDVVLGWDEDDDIETVPAHPIAPPVYSDHDFDDHHDMVSYAHPSGLSPPRPKPIIFRGPPSSIIWHRHKGASVSTVVRSKRGRSPDEVEIVSVRPLKQPWSALPPGTMAHAVGRVAAATKQIDGEYVDEEGDDVPSKAASNKSHDSMSDLGTVITEEDKDEVSATTS
ncbi:hypothetical protein B0H15DRAFT_954381 [Mycena belliarum]|uniref:Uncharacterized protein n=1 Tax=Mycena belliarum TaxID=1033014 RepID=A0AAD6TYJ0_9AGAR|nr:hypothetical protein B0H15DRAFT_954381 [Mycena belliae]